MDTPLITVIIPTYNRADYIGAAIESVRRQSFKNFELLVLDDASTDATEKTVGEFIKKDARIRYIRNTGNLGIAANRNKGIAQARGTYIAMLDSDDLWIDTEKLAKQVAFLEKNRDHALIGTQLKTIDAEGVALGPMQFFTDDRQIRKHILRRNQFAQSSVLFLKKAAEEAGLYGASLVVNEDYDLWLKIGMKYKFANIADVATGYRVHENSIIRRKKLIAARIHLDIITKYRHDYPGFYSALFKGYVRILLGYFS